MWCQREQETCQSQENCKNTWACQETRQNEDICRDKQMREGEERRAGRYNDIVPRQEVHWSSRTDSSSTGTPHRCLCQSLLNRWSVGNVHLLCAFHFGTEGNAQHCNSYCHREKITVIFYKTSIIIRQLIVKGSDELTVNTQLATTGEQWNRHTPRPSELGSLLKYWRIFPKTTYEALKEFNLMDIYHLNFCILLTDVKYFVHSFRTTRDLDDKETDKSVNDGREVRPTTMYFVRG
jgi:hypothetical protein